MYPERLPIDDVIGSPASPKADSREDSVRGTATAKVDLALGIVGNQICSFSTSPRPGSIHRRRKSWELHRQPADLGDDHAHDSLHGRAQNRRCVAVIAGRQSSLLPARPPRLGDGPIVEAIVAFRSPVVAVAPPPPFDAAPGADGFCEVEVADLAPAAPLPDGRCSIVFLDAALQ